jgi:hypothetical protein
LCCIFSFETAEEALGNLDFEILELYGNKQYNLDGTYKHSLHSGDEGGRMLIRCKKCGALFLRQYSKYDSESEGIPGPNGHYTCFFPVKNREEALDYNERYDKISIKYDYQGIWLAEINDHYSWIAY